MRPLSATDVVALWERGAAKHPVDQALAILAAGCPELVAGLPDMPIGERDGWLVALRTATFGSPWEVWSECPACSERVELEVPADEIVAGHGEGGRPPETAMRVREVDVVVRWPTSRDLAAVAAGASVDEARRRLLLRCVVRAARDGEALSPEQLSPEVEQAIADRLDEIEDSGEILLSIVCPACEAAWRVSFDPCASFWAEITAHARRLLRDVHALASAYGWREADVLAMSPLRREAYLAMVGT